MLNREGADKFFAWPMSGDHTNDFFQGRYAADGFGAVTKLYPIEDLDLASEGSTPYSQYNWELFFHIPLLVATRLATNQKFEDALTWFHFIFDPARARGTASSTVPPPMRCS